MSKLIFIIQYICTDIIVFPEVILFSGVRQPRYNLYVISNKTGDFTLEEAAVSADDVLIFRLVEIILSDHLKQTNII